ncbi:MAG: hybrid sensor histidine kinase/response regulator [Burkholderiaceae bacterium]|nr:hybrid sensor histidine kinase/response regulator [Burkholderiaceae bacterium]
MMVEFASADARPEVSLLVVDDIEQNRIAMRALLERPGLRVLTATGGIDALEVLLENEVALALVDVQMPGMDGFELAELMRGAERTRAIPIIFVTAAPIDARRSFRGYEAGAVDFLNKPIDPKVLQGKVDVFVELYEQRRQLHRRLIELEHALSLNEMMVAVLTHDLRTPLSAIGFTAELLLRTAPDDSVRQSAVRLKSSASRMAALITQLLDFSRIRAGALRLDARPVDVGELVEGVVGELLQATPDAGIELRVVGDARATLDPDRVSQVVSNLVSNALRHGNPGSGVRVVVDGGRSDSLRVEVENAGRIDPLERTRLFEPFRTRSGREGLGLGLYIVDQFVRAHRGSVFVDADRPGRVVFGFSLPRGELHPAVVEQAPVDDDSEQGAAI